MQAGSSIMPGKVNPVIPEVVNQIAFDVIGNDVTVTLAAEGGQLQLNAFEPIIARALFGSLEHLAAGARVLTTHCVRGITANADRLAGMVAESIGLVTALSPQLGYERASAIAQEAQLTGRGAVELVLEHGLLTREQIDAALSPDALAGLRGNPCDHGRAPPAAAAEAAGATTRPLTRRRPVPGVPRSAHRPPRPGRPAGR